MTGDDTKINFGGGGSRGKLQSLPPLFRARAYDEVTEGVGGGVEEPADASGAGAGTGGEAAAGSTRPGDIVFILCTTYCTDRFAPQVQ